MRNAMNKTVTGLAVIVLVLAGGCGESGTNDSKAPAPDGASTAQLPEGLWLASTPAGAPTGIAELKASAKTGDKVVARVMIGGRVAPMVENMAVMTVVDASLDNPCYGDDDHCETPWDYCCNDPDVLMKQTATVQINDKGGKPLAVDVTGAGLTPGSVVVVVATVSDRPNTDTLILNAEGLFIEPTQAAPH